MTILENSIQARKQERADAFMQLDDLFSEINGFSMSHIKESEAFDLENTSNIPLGLEAANDFFSMASNIFDEQFSSISNNKSHQAASVRRSRREKSSDSEISL